MTPAAENIFWKDLGGACDAVGTPEFYGALGSTFASLIGSERWMVMRYGQKATPETLKNHKAMTDETFRLYERGLHRFDPLARLAKQSPSKAVICLSNIRETDDNSRYFNEFYRTARIDDELVIFLPLEDGAKIALVLEREGDNFNIADIGMAEAAARTFLGLHAAHLRLSEKLVTQASNDSQLTEPDHDDPPAYDDLILAMSIRHRMTDRERDIVHLALRGYPNALISKELGITPGTVRNHRANLYAKLDITTERELFALFLDNLVAL